MKAGALRNRITLQVKSVTRDAFGGEIIAWTDVATVWAETDPWNLRERMTMRRQQGNAVISFRVRAPLAVSLDKRVVFDGTAYDIVEIDASRKHRGELLFIAAGEEIAA
jgi:SPP1 family predicted phage head-tail adaptor